MAIYRDRIQPIRLLAPRVARKKKAQQQERQPGQVSATLRRRLGDALADIFDQFGPEIYSEAVLALKDVILAKFSEGFGALDQTVREELGRRGVEESNQHIRAWSNEIVEDVNHMGLDEVAGALEDYVGTLAAEYQQPEPGEGDELLEIEDEELEPVDIEEIDEETVEPEEGEPAELDFEDLGIEMPGEEEAVAAVGLRGRRRRPSTQRFRREATVKHLTIAIPEWNEGEQGYELYSHDMAMADSHEEWAAENSAVEINDPGIMDQGDDVEDLRVYEITGPYGTVQHAVFWMTWPDNEYTTGGTRPFDRTGGPNPLVEAIQAVRAEDLVQPNGFPVDFAEDLGGYRSGPGQRFGNDYDVQWLCDDFAPNAQQKRAVNDALHRLNLRVRDLQANRMGEREYQDFGYSVGFDVDRWQDGWHLLADVWTFDV